MKKILIITAMSALAFAAPAFKGDIEFRQKDGTTFKGKLKGDEYFNWIEDEKKHIIKYSNHSKNYEFARLKKVGQELDLIPSGVKVGSKLSTLSENKSKIDKDLLIKIWKQKRKKMTIRHLK